VTPPTGYIAADFTTGAFEVLTVPNNNTLLLK